MSHSTAIQDGDQAEVIAFLSDPASYTPSPRKVQRCETHGALVFLAGREAWKIKRAVRFPYMDFSTLARRRAVCEREVEINRRLAPDLYLGCVPITRKPDGGLELGGTGEPVEWAVHMRRFDEGQLLSRMAQWLPLPTGLTNDIADAVYASHRAADPAPGVDGAARFERLVDSVTATLADLAETGNALARDEVQELRRRMTAALQAAAGTLQARSAVGLVRRCHGDLHLNNIVLWEGWPLLFDAIEFDDDLATIDTLYDLAFLLMDLDIHDQRPAANAVLNRYLWRSGADLDFYGLRALPLFLATRSAVRAMVTAERAEQAQGKDQARARREAARYLGAALAYLEPPPPRLIAVGGLSGTGKSTLGRALAPKIGPAPGAVHLRSDLERKSLFRVAETTTLSAEAYTAEANARVYGVLARKAGLVLAAGHGVVVDAVFADAGERARIEAVAARAGVPFAGLWLEAPPDSMMARVAARRGDASDATPDVVRRQLEHGMGALSARWTPVDAGGSREATLEKALAVLTHPI